MWTKLFESLDMPCLDLFRFLRQGSHRKERLPPTSLRHDENQEGAAGLGTDVWRGAECCGRCQHMRRAGRLPEGCVRWDRWHAQPIRSGRQEPTVFGHGRRNPARLCQSRQSLARRSSEQLLLETTTSMPALRSIKHQPRSLRPRTCAVLKKLFQHHTHSHEQWVKKRDESRAAMWAWLEPAVLVGPTVKKLTAGLQLKLSLQLADKRPALADSGMWTELLRAYVRDLLTHAVDTRRAAIGTMQLSTTHKADTFRASDWVDSSKTHGHRKKLQTMSDISALVAFDVEQCGGLIRVPADA